ncbi:MAG TPA: deoxyribodipyrimidine photo-lyase [Luteolibacter sp.]|nr:deoxyribodipyrimidine photo-lyase [Luteolibacter sp.]
MPKDGSKPVVYWNRRDFRLLDNEALHAAARSGRPVIPVHFLSGWSHEHPWTGAKRQQFLCDCLASWARNLESIGGHLILRHGDPVAGLKVLLRQSGATELHYQAAPDPFGKSVEGRVEQVCRDLGVAVHRHFEVALHGPDEVLTKGGTPFRVYTPYSRAWLALDKGRAPLGKPKPLQTPSDIASEPLPGLDHWGLKALPSGTHLLEAGERAARKRLKTALEERLGAYTATRDFPALDGTSRLSQDLRFGLLSIRSVYAAALEAAQQAKPAQRANISKFIGELIWREFYFAILHHWPEVLDHEFNAEWRGLAWDEPGENFERWKNGTTGFPIVDSGMRELVATGHMHNRVRMITAMFLTKDLHIDWKLGESFFLQHLIDGEIASNNGGWQWSAGTGADAAPYFRIQNPWSQSARYDAKGDYIRRWIPELAKVAADKLHAPPADGKPLAPGYPLPCVDHKTERERTLAIFKRHRAERR